MNVRDAAIQVLQEAGAAKLQQPQSAPDSIPISRKTETILLLFLPGRRRLA